MTRVCQSPWIIFHLFFSPAKVVPHTMWSSFLRPPSSDPVAFLRVDIREDAREKKKKKTFSGPLTSTDPSKNLIAL